MADYISKYETGAAVDAALDLAMSALQPETGKGLSTNDFTNEYKDKVDSNDAEISSARGSYTTVNDRLNAIKSEQESQGAALDEDRAALVEIVDSGAKNLLNLLTPNINNRMTITDAWNGSITASCNNVTWAYSSYDFSLTSGEKYKFIIYVDSASVSDVQFQCFVNDVSESTSQELGRTRRITSIGMYTVDFVASSKIRIGINLNNSDTAATGSATYHAMLCTEAAWNISQQYVPHRPSYDELIARIEALEAGT